ncbi:MAG: epoxyqueuosine reductase QueH [Bacteroidales bacterium]|jgi:predicted adenine nucleotide alpha hydrolase (AANH) superfamily ATPase|nr:epoxyqueuosine reductase QueH [Bacteroidales bacterium]
MNKILLHSCCAPCSAAVLEWLLNNNFVPTLFYYNPNIFPKEEYEKRKNELTRHALRLDVEVIDGDYNHEEWLSTVKGLEHLPERSIRCEKCFEIRLNKTAEKTAQLHISQFATTLSSSRWKDLAQISDAGNKAAVKYDNVSFFDRNWRKDGLQQRRNELMKENNFYNQIYCGCEFSVR